VLWGARASDVGNGGRAVQPGGGIDFHTKSGLTVRNEIDYCLVSAARRGVSGGRWIIGVVFGPG
jgi:hypothetical protein